MVEEKEKEKENENEEEREKTANIWCERDYIGFTE